MKMKIERFFDGWEESDVQLEEGFVGNPENVRTQTLNRIQKQPPRKARKFAILLAAAIAVLLAGTAAAVTIHQLQARKTDGDIVYHHHGSAVIYHDDVVSGILLVPGSAQAGGCLIGVIPGELPDLGGHATEAVTSLKTAVRNQLALSKSLADCFPGKTESNLSEREWVDLMSMQDRYQHRITEAEVEAACSRTESADAVTYLRLNNETSAFMICVQSGLTTEKELVMEDDCEVVKQGTLNGMDAVWLTRDRRARFLKDVPEESRASSEPFYLENLIVLYHEEYGCYIVVAGNMAAFDFEALETIAQSLTIIPTSCPVVTQTQDNFGGVIPGIEAG